MAIPSVCLIAILNIGLIVTQNVGQNCPAPLALRDCNPTLNPQQNVFTIPSNGLSAVPSFPLPECQRMLQDVAYPFIPNQLVSVGPGSLALQGPGCPQAIQSQPCPVPAGPEFNNILPGSPVFKPQQMPLLPPLNLIPPPPTQAVASGPCSAPIGPPFTQIIQASNLGAEPTAQGPKPFPQINIQPYPNGLTFRNPHLTPLLPMANPAAPCADIIPSQGISPGSLPAMPLNNQLSSNILPIDTLPLQGVSLGVTQCPPVLNGPPIIPSQGSLFPASQINCSPAQILSVLPENLPNQFSPTICPPSIQLQDSVPFSFRLPRPSIFPVSPAFVSEFPVPCDATYSGPLQTISPICPGLIQQEVIPYPQTPINPCSPLPPQNTPSAFNSLLTPCGSTSPALNTVSCPLKSDVASVNLLPASIIPQPGFAASQNLFGPILPLNQGDCPLFLNSQNAPSFYQIGELPPVLPTPTYEEPCQSGENVPIPINLQINLPAPTVPAPQITIINTPPDPLPYSDEIGYNAPYPMPPIILEGGRKSRSWLPLVLVALFAQDGEWGNDGGCCYNSGDSSPIPIPYPIPVPINNPVMVKSRPRSSRNRGKKQ